MSSILSTKILTPAQQELLLNANLRFVTYNAIAIDFLQVNSNTDYDYHVFTSQNGVTAFFRNKPDAIALEKEVFCVGGKTKILLEKKGLKVIEMAQNSFKLSEIIAKKYLDSSFLLYSGNLRRPELANVLLKNNIRYKEYIVYDTLPKYKRFDTVFDGILFFSPSGVQSFTKENNLKTSWAFCIGETTAKEAKKYTEHVLIANKPTVENVVELAIEHFNS